MPRAKSNRCLLNDLLSALVGAPHVNHMVCEFTCSCCRSSVASAADALCSFLADGSAEALSGFSSKNGSAALQVGLTSSNDAVVCASIRVLGAVLQAVVRCAAAGAATTPSSQQQCLAGREQHATCPTAPVLHPARNQQQEQRYFSHQNSGCRVDDLQQQNQAVATNQLCMNSTRDAGFLDVDEQSTLAANISDSSWKELLQLLLRSAGSSGAQSVAAQAVALQELQHLLLLLAEAIQPSPAVSVTVENQPEHLLEHDNACRGDHAAAAANTQAFTCTGPDVSKEAAESVEYFSAANASPMAVYNLLLDGGVMVLALSALRHEHQDVRR